MKKTLLTIFLLLFGFLPASANNYSSALLNGSTQYFSASDSASLSVTGSLTFELWYKAHVLPAAGDYDVFVSKQTSTGNQRSYYFAYNNNAGTPDLFFYATPAGDGTGQTTSSVNWTATVARWYHIAVTKDGSGNVKFYVDCQQQGATQTGAATTQFDSTATFNIGFEPNSAGFTYLDGKIDDVRIYAAQRTQSQICSDYKQELKGNEANLNAYWTLNGGSLKDSTSNANTLTNSGNTLFSGDVPFSNYSFWHVF